MQNSNVFAASCVDRKTNGIGTLVYEFFDGVANCAIINRFHTHTRKQGLHQSHTMDGCSAPLVVKFADTQKEKEQKKMQQMQANLWNLAAANINIGQAATTVAPPILPNPPQQPSPILAADAISPASLHLLQQLQAVGLQQQILQGKTDRTAPAPRTGHALTAHPIVELEYRF